MPDQQLFREGACWKKSFRGKRFPAPNFLERMEAGDLSVLEQISRIGRDLLRQESIPKQAKYMDGFSKLVNTLGLLLIKMEGRN